MKEHQRQIQPCRHRRATHDFAGGICGVCGIDALDEDVRIARLADAWSPYPYGSDANEEVGR